MPPACPVLSSSKCHVSHKGTLSEGDAHTQSSEKPWTRREKQGSVPSQGTETEEPSSRGMASAAPVVSPTAGARKAS